MLCTLLTDLNVLAIFSALTGAPILDEFVRDWLKANPDSNYDLPQDVIDKTIAKYLEAYELLTGKKL